MAKSMFQHGCRLEMPWCHCYHCNCALKDSSRSQTWRLFQPSKIFMHYWLHIQPPKPWKEMTFSAPVTCNTQSSLWLAFVFVKYFFISLQWRLVATDIYDFNFQDNNKKNVFNCLESTMSYFLSEMHQQTVYTNIHIHLDRQAQAVRCL